MDFNWWCRTFVIAGVGAIVYSFLLNHVPFAAAHSYVTMIFVAVPMYGIAGVCDELEEEKKKEK